MLPIALSFLAATLLQADCELQSRQFLEDIRRMEATPAWKAWNDQDACVGITEGWDALARASCDVDHLSDSCRPLLAESFKNIHERMSDPRLCTAMATPEAKKVFDEKIRLWEVGCRDASLRLMFSRYVDWVPPHARLFSSPSARCVELAQASEKVSAMWETSGEYAALKSTPEYKAYSALRELQSSLGCGKAENALSPVCRDIAMESRHWDDISRHSLAFCAVKTSPIARQSDAIMLEEIIHSCWPPKQ